MKAQEGVTRNNTQIPNKLLVDCGSTADIITDESKFFSFDQSFKPEAHYFELAEPCQIMLYSKDKMWILPIIDSTGRFVTISLKNALYIPSYFQYKLQQKKVQVLCSIQRPQNKSAKVVQNSASRSMLNFIIYM